MIGRDNSNNSYDVIKEFEFGVISDIAEGMQWGTLQVVRDEGDRSPVDELFFRFGNRRRICQLGPSSRTRRGVLREPDGPLIWRPASDLLIRSADLPENRLVVFERTLDHHWSHRRKIVVAGKWALYDNHRYVLTRTNSVWYAIRDKVGRKVWSGLYSHQTKCRIDDTNTEFPNLFECQSIMFRWGVRGPLTPANPMRTWYDKLQSATVITANPQEEQRSATTGRRAV